MSLKALKTVFKRAKKTEKVQVRKETEPAQVKAEKKARFRKELVNFHHGFDQDFVPGVRSVYNPTRGTMGKVNGICKVKGIHSQM